MYNVELKVNGETVDIKRLPTATINKIVKEFEDLRVTYTVRIAETEGKFRPLIDRNLKELWRGDKFKDYHAAKNAGNLALTHIEQENNHWNINKAAILYRYAN